MRKLAVFFAGIYRKSLFKSKIKKYIFSVHSKIIQTELLLSGATESGSSLGVYNKRLGIQAAYFCPDGVKSKKEGFFLNSVI